MKKCNLIYMLLSVCFVLGSCSIKDPKMICIMTFDEFAYSAWRLDEDIEKTDIMLPTTPWRAEANVPTQQDAGFNPPHRLEVVLSRPTKQGPEIWIYQEKYSTAIDPKKKTEFLIYTTASKSWRHVSGNIEGTDYYVDRLFLMGDGSIWGETRLGNFPGEDPLNTINNVPVLSKYNQNSYQFEFAIGAYEIEVSRVDDPNFSQFSIVPSTDYGMWIFLENDGVYYYDYRLQKTNKTTSIPNLNITQVSNYHNGNIYVLDYRLDKMTEPYFHLYDGTIFVFNSESEDFQSIELPNDTWPIFSGLLVTKTGQLWLGSVGYRDIDGSWALIHPSPTKFFENAGDPAWAPPQLVLESVDGLLWYKKDLDMDRRSQGTAWYDPELEKGCMFTNLPVNIIEDEQQKLWLVANDILFSFDNLAE